MSRRKTGFNERTVAAEALRRAAHDVVRPYPVGPLMCSDRCGDSNCPDDIRVEVAYQIAEWLESRAVRDA